MLFPESQRVVFGRNPLREVVCQLNFPTILRIPSETPSEFQEVIRQHYPRYQSQQPTMPPDFSQALAKFGLGNGNHNLTHRFLSDDESSGVSLTAESVAVWTNQYRQWESFLAEIVRAREALEGAYSPSTYDRIGLRYIDLLDRRALELAHLPWHELVSAPLVGLLGEQSLAPSVLDCRGQLTLGLDEPVGSLVRITHGLSDGNDKSQDAYVIDADFYTTTPIGGDHVIDTLNQFNRVAGNFFRWTISKRLFDALEPADTSP